MPDCKEKLADKDFQNWLKAALAVSKVKKGIEQYVLNVTTHFHEDTLKDILTAEEIKDEAFCSTCTTESLSKHTSCNSNICDRLKTKIKHSHKHHVPSWKNTEVSKWCRCPWELAKCYMPPDGYRAVDSVSETDLNGLLSVMMNNLAFRNPGKPFDEDACIKARDVTKAVRHSPNLSMDDQEWKVNLDTLIKFIDCPTYMENNPECQTALEDLKKLKETKLQISTDDITEVLKDNVRHDIKESTDQSLLLIEQKKNQCLQEIIEEISKMQAKTSEHLEHVLSTERETLSGMVSTLEEMKHTSDQLRQLTPATGSDENYGTLKVQLKEDLIIFNKKLHSTIPLSPLFEKKDTPLVGFYVSPSINCVEHPMGESHRSDIKTEINDISDIFKAKRCNEIYVTSKAGLGKTVFCKYLVVTWCMAQSLGEFETQSESQVDFKVMQGFDYVFLVPLRETRALDCEVDRMIQHQIIKYLARSGRYKLSFLQDVLTKESCLIILDGLDEWTHPKGKVCKTFNDIPHRHARENCTILTTTRTWKFCSLSLSTNQIDIHAQIAGLGDKAAEQLVENAVSKFKADDISDIQKNIDDFHHRIQNESISKFRSVPLILIHLIHLWRKHHSFGDSYCAIFSNIIGLHLHRAEIKSKAKPPPAKRNCLDKPNCISANDYCSAFYDDVLKSLGRLAFETFFDKSRENSLVFDVTTVKRYLGNKFQLCLSTGLLTENICFEDKLSEDDSRVSFAHKTFQEYFAALYMYTVIDSPAHIQMVMKVCRTEKDILSVSQFYIFLSGICPKIAGTLSLQFYQVIACSNTVKGYRSDMGSWNYFVGYNETIKKLQTLFVDGVNESKDNGHKPVEFRMDDIIIDLDFHTEKYSTALKTSMEKNGKYVKSVKIRDVKTREEFSDITQLLRRGGETRLEKLDLKCEICEESVEALLHGSADTLKCFIVKGGRWTGNHWCHNHVSLSNKSLQIVWTMKQLEELYLRNIEMTHGQFEQLIGYVSRSSNMKHVGLGFLKCKKHDYSCSGVKLDLSCHSHLRMLEIGSIPISEIQINTQSLEVCYVGSFEHSDVLSTVFSSLTRSEKLHVFCCGFLTTEADIDKMLNMVPFLTNLQHIWLINMDLGHKTVKLNPSMVNIENVFMIRVQMDVNKLIKLTEEATAIKRSVRVGLFDCTVDRPDEYEREINRMKESHAVHVVQEDTKSQRDFVFRTVRDSPKDAK